MIYCQRPEPTSVFPSGATSLFFDHPCDLPVSNDIISSLTNSLARSRQANPHKRQLQKYKPVQLPRVTTEEDESNYYLLLEKPRQQQHGYYSNWIPMREQHPFNSYQFKIENGKLMVRSLKDQYSRSFELPDDADKSQNFELHEFSYGFGLAVVIKKITAPEAESEDEEMEEEDNAVDFADLLAHLFGHPVEHHHQELSDFKKQKQLQLQANAEAETTQRKKAEQLKKAKEEEEQKQRAAELKRLARQRKLNELKEKRRVRKEQQDLKKQKQGRVEKMSNLIRIHIQPSSPANVEPTESSVPTTIVPTSTNSTADIVKTSPAVSSTTLNKEPDCS
ncbi:unnamed protein product [Ambrosiozyma monospora]|uniref:Unnamed protein product n=1 Tax=Ambrosiozyma monospora TaxID=43982 RepID=A0ACB5T3A7_AMBMO|nr:unnamed protein product [Ambrosiozyma monospora]